MQIFHFSLYRTRVLLIKTIYKYIRFSYCITTQYNHRNLHYSGMYIKCVVMYPVPEYEQNELIPDTPQLACC